MDISKKLLTLLNPSLFRSSMCKVRYERSHLPKQHFISRVCRMFLHLIKQCYTSKRLLPAYKNQRWEDFDWSLLFLCFPCVGEPSALWCSAICFPAPLRQQEQMKLASLPENALRKLKRWKQTYIQWQCCAVSTAKSSVYLFSSNRCSYS